MPNPNILLITTDQQRFDAAGGAGPSFLRTPHFDHLRRQGITYSRAYSDCPICVPTRTSIMTGLQAFNHGMLGNGSTSDVLRDTETLPGRLRTQGYQSVAIGKMHFTPERARHGFDEMLIGRDYYESMLKSGYDVKPMRHGLGQNELYPGMATVPESLTYTSWTAEQSVNFIRERRDPNVPFFLWCSFSKPHPPLDPPEPYYSMYRNSPIPDPVFGDWSEPGKSPAAFDRWRQEWSLDLLPPEIIREARAAYYGLITQIDYNMGRVFAALQDVGLFDETLIIYCSDHGEYIGDHHSGCKIFFHEPSAHVPFVVRPPRTETFGLHGTVCDSLIAHCDILPTCLAAAGAPESGGGDGLDLLSLARGETQSREYLEAQAGNYGRYTAITDGRWKYIWYPEGASEQLFDLETDPHELHDLSSDHSSNAQKMRLHDELVRRHKARNSDMLAGDRLISAPIVQETEADRRRRAWPGYHTEYLHTDIQH